MQLTQPEKPVKEALDSEVAYEDHFVGYKLHGMAGGSKMRLYTLEEVLNFMHADSREKLLEVGGGGTVGYVDFDELAAWTRNVVGDEELADAILEQAQTADNYKDQVAAVSTVIEKRLKQAAIR